MSAQQLLASLGIDAKQDGAWIGGRSLASSGADVVSTSPGGGDLASVRMAGADEYEAAMIAARAAFQNWRMWPAPRRGEVVRKIGEALRANKEALGDLVSLEVGKVRSEGHGEVQEMIDICDFAVGLSRQLYGLTMHSERPLHRMYEQWHPLGVVGVISAFNFPVAVWMWNAALAWVCGDVTLWKPSEKAPLTAIACQKIAAKVFEAEGCPEGLSTLLVGDGAGIGEQLCADKRVPLVSATGSVRMGKRVAAVVAGRLGRTILELGGNNAIVVSPEADLELATRAIAFGALGTAGQRCTSTRRVYAHASVFDELKRRLVKIYETAAIGDPLDDKTLVGPLIDTDAVENVQRALREVAAQGGTVLCGGEPLSGAGYESGCYMLPALAEIAPDAAIVQEETFGPLLYLMQYENLDDAIAMHNDVPQGLSSAIFTRNVLESETFLSHRGSDCGIANVNIGTSGAEIGGAFGGEKDTGGGRESGSDAWKAYMRRQTNTINWSTELPLAQGVEFDV